MACSVILLFAAAMYGLYAYRGLVKSLAARSSELPVADELSQHVGNLRVILAQARERHTTLNGDVLRMPSVVVPVVDDRAASWSLRDMRQHYRAQYDHFCVTLERYRELLDTNAEHLDTEFSNDQAERKTLDAIDKVIASIDANALNENWWTNDPAGLEDDIDKLRLLVSDLPSHLHRRLNQVAGDVADRYRVAITVACGTGLSSLVLLGWGIQFFRRTVSHPLDQLVTETRVIAGGNFDHRIATVADDEIGELARALNDMTTRFRDIRDDLDLKVREQSRQIVRSEQLASVGYLAAGVAHEINNPLASIALCSESLEGRLRDLIDDQVEGRPDWDIVASYLEMIQREAFRCKQITDKLLDFSRMGDSQRHHTELRDLVTSVIDMVKTLGRYHDKKLVLAPGEPVVAEVNPQEIKQVVLNLITNGLDCVATGGRVEVSVQKHDGVARIVVADDGCGMTDEVREHLFEPFFTRRREGQGTGLGLSISYRIVSEHGGSIAAHSEGEGQGATFVVELPPRGASQPRKAA
jgi:signal transduction histidine kinase